jgi:hypothetical protein
MKSVALASRPRVSRNSFEPGWGTDIPSQLLAWPGRTAFIRLGLLLFVILPILLVAGTVGMMLGSMAGGETGALHGGIMGALAGSVALLLGARS